MKMSDPEQYKLVKVTGGGKVSIPGRIRKKYDIKVGDYLAVYEENEKIIYQKLDLEKLKELISKREKP